MTHSSANYHLQGHTGVNYGKYYLIDESIRRTLKNTSKDNGYDTSYERLYYYVNPKDDRSIFFNAIELIISRSCFSTLSDLLYGLLDVNLIQAYALLL